MRNNENILIKRFKLSSQFTKDSIDLYKEFLVLVYILQNKYEAFEVPDHIRNIWEKHILDNTEEYLKYCQQTFGKNINYISKIDASMNVASIRDMIENCPVELTIIRKYLYNIITD